MTLNNPRDRYGKIPFTYRVESGNAGLNYYESNIFGFNADVGTSYEDVWSPGGNLSFLSAADTLDVSSDDPADKGTPTAGTGARTIRIVGLNGSYEQISEDITLDGTNTVTTNLAFLRVYKVFVLTAGTGEVNAGTINLQDTSGASIQAQIQPERSQTLMAIYTTRAQYYGFINGMNVALGGADTAEVEIRTRSSEGVRRVRYIENLSAGESITLDWLSYNSSILVPPKTDIIMRAKKTGAGGTTTVAGSFYLTEAFEEEINTSIIE